MKNIVITGSTRGLGFAMAKEFLKAGCSVTLSGRGAELGTEAVSSLTDFKDRYIYIQCDVQIYEDIQRLWELSKSNGGA